MNPILRDAKIEKTVHFYLGELSEDEANKTNEEKLKLERKKGYLKGLEEGESVGYDKAMKEFSSLFPLMRAVTQKLLEKRDNVLFELKREIIELAIGISEKILREELSSKETLARVIGSYLTFCCNSFQKDVVKVSLAPEDLLMLEKHLDEISYDKTKIVELMFFPDAILQRGDFRIETKTFLLNCTLDRELEDLRAKVLEP